MKRFRNVVVCWLLAFTICPVFAVDRINSVIELIGVDENKRPLIEPSTSTPSEEATVSIILGEGNSTKDWFNWKKSIESDLSLPLETFWREIVKSSAGPQKITLSCVITNHNEVRNIRIIQTAANKEFEKFSIGLLKTLDKQSILTYPTNGSEMKKQRLVLTFEFKQPVKPRQQQL